MRLTLSATDSARYLAGDQKVCGHMEAAIHAWAEARRPRIEEPVVVVLRDTTTVAFAFTLDRGAR